MKGFDQSVWGLDPSTQQVAGSRDEPRGCAERGVGKLTLLVFGTLAAVVVFVGYNVLPFYYYYFDLKNQFTQVIKVASVEPDSEIRKKLMYFIKKYEIPCEAEDLKIERSDGSMRISLKYTEVFYVTWQDKDYTIHEFDFDATVSGTFKQR